MRITESMLYNMSTGAMSQGMQNLMKSAEQVSTTKRLNRPSDNPTDVRSAVKLRDSLAELDQFGRNIDSASRWVGAADTALASAGELVQRANELSVQGANSTLSASDREAMAKEVEQLAGAMGEAASAQVGDQYIFSGYRTDRQPFVVGSAATVGTYQGDQGVVSARVAPDTNLPINLTADKVFQPAFDALKRLYDDLVSGQPVQQTTIGQVQDALQTVLDARAEAGARVNRLDQTKSSQEALLEDSQKLQSELEDADMSQAITEFSQRQTTYDAALKVNARIMQNSLIDYLR